MEFAAAPGTAAAATAADPAAAAAGDLAPEPLCRVCYDAADGEIGGELLTPCQCRGTMRFIHQSCLQELLQHAHPVTRMRCSVCRAAYVLPPGFEVPPTFYNQQQLQQQVWDVEEEALAEGRLRAWQPLPGRPLGLTLVVGGTAAAMVATALLSVWLARRYDAQQMEQQRRQAEEHRRQRQKERQYHKWVREQRIPELQAENAQLEAQLEALRTYQRLDRWLPPPLVGQQRQRLERAIAGVRQAALEVELSGNELILAIYDWQRVVGSDSHSDKASDRGDAHSGSSDEDSSSGSNSGPRSRRSQRRRQAVGQGGRHNLAEPVLRAVRGVLRHMGRQ